MALKVRAHSTTYIVELPAADFAALLAHETSMGKVTPLAEAADGIEGVDNTQYGEEFPDEICYSVDAEDDRPDTHAAVASLIEQAIDAAHAHAALNVHPLKPRASRA